VSGPEVALNWPFPYPIQPRMSGFNFQRNSKLGFNKTCQRLCFVSNA
jgi:hypothetical protein